jgi:hypothetical protein
LRPCTSAFVDARTLGLDKKENFTIVGHGVSEFGPLLARAAATPREALRSGAAKRAGVAASSVEEAACGFRLPTGETVSFAALAQAPGRDVTASDALDALPRVALRSMSGSEHPRRAAGRSVPTNRVDAIMRGGEVLYAGNVTRPGLVEASLVRPPRLGARRAGFDLGNQSGSSCREASSSFAQRSGDSIEMSSGPSADLSAAPPNFVMALCCAVGSAKSF